MTSRRMSLRRIAIRPRAARPLGMWRAMASAAIVVSLLTSAAIFGPQSGAVGQTAQSPSAADGPEMTDSIIRLYQGFFLRAPDAMMFKDLSNKYQSGNASLSQIGDELAASDDFESRYGDVSNERFVTLAFRNVLNEDPTNAERTTWASTLATGYSRGAFMLALTESEGFVTRTGTTAPMAGYLRWYPDGTHWYCGDGPVRGLATAELTGEDLHADYMLRNNASEDASFGVYTVDGGVRSVTVASGSIPGRMTMYRWDGLFSGDGSYGTNVDVEVREETSWIVVFYPESIGESRLGWQITK